MPDKPTGDDALLRTLADKLRAFRRLIDGCTKPHPDGREVVHSVPLREAAEDLANAAGAVHQYQWSQHAKVESTECGSTGSMAIGRGRGADAVTMAAWMDVVNIVAYKPGELPAKRWPQGHVFDTEWLAVVDRALLLAEGSPNSQGVPTQGEPARTDAIADSPDDSLLRHLRQFRSDVVAEKERSPTAWMADLQRIRSAAAAVGLRPADKSWAFVMATNHEACEWDEGCPLLLGIDLDATMTNWVILIPAEESPMTFHHDLSNSFRRYRGHALLWVDSWILARERQLRDRADGATVERKPTADDLRPARWFADATGPDGLYSELLKAARNAGKLPSSEKPHGHWLYSASDVARNWPEYRGRIMKKLAGEAVTNGNDR